jgi:glycerol uptake facilitator-like aquaporin
VHSLSRRLTAEAVGTALLLTAVVGSGIMAQRLSGGNLAIALLANAIATGGALVAIILAFAPISGAHLNPAVTLADALRNGIAWRDVPWYIVAQLLGAVAGVMAANLMFALPPVFFSHHVRGGVPLWLGEFVATFGLLAVIWGCAASRREATPYAVAAYIVGAYWFTSSTSFANPAVTIARSLSDTFAGIRPSDIPEFIVAQLAGAGAATALFTWLTPMVSAQRGDPVLLPHETEPMRIPDPGDPIATRL